MKKLNEIFNAKDWRAFFATKIYRGAKLPGLGKAYFTVWAHATNLDEPVIGYILSPNCDELAEFAAAGQLLGIEEIGVFVAAVKEIFPQQECISDQEFRIGFLNETVLKNWDGKAEPFPFAEEKRLAMIAALDKVFEASMLENCEVILSMAGKFEPLLGHKSLKKLAKRTANKNSK